MGIWMQKARGVLGTGLLWGLLGGVVGVIGGVVGSVTDPMPLWEWVLTLGLGFSGFGFLAGAGFAATLATLDGRRTLAELSTARAALWGGLAGFGLPLGLVVALSGGALPLLPALGVAAAFGAVTSTLGAGMVHVARSRDAIEEAGAEDLLPGRTL